MAPAIADVEERSTYTGEVCALGKTSPLFTIGNDKKNKSVGDSLGDEKVKTVRAKANSYADNSDAKTPARAKAAPSDAVTKHESGTDADTTIGLTTEDAADAPAKTSKKGSKRIKKTLSKSKSKSATVATVAKATDAKNSELKKNDDSGSTDETVSDTGDAKNAADEPASDKNDLDNATDEATSDTDDAKSVDTEDAKSVDTEDTKSVDAEDSKLVTETKSRRGLWKWIAAAVVLLAIPIVLLVVALRDIGQGRSSRGVDVAGVSTGQKSETQVTALVDELAADFAESEITVETEQGPFVATAAQLGITVDAEATVSEVMEIGYTGSTVAQVAAWFGSFTGEKSVPLVLDVPTQDRVNTWVDDTSIDIEPVEPVISRSRSGFEFEPGVVGRRLRTEAIVESIPTRLNRASLPVLSASFDVLPPELADDAPSAAVDLVNRNTADGLDITVAAESRSVDATALRRWISIDTESQDVTIDGSAVDRYLSTEFADLAEDGDAARFEVVDREPNLILPLYRGRICCRDESAQEILDVVLDGDSEVALRLDTNPSARTAEWAENLKIVEEIGGFTTRHPCCAGRVRNIQRMADLVKGAIIEPGDLFSLNEYVGKRTRERGFTGGGVIYDGVFTEDIGGGVSQFVTTLFNAAFFAGLDFGEYQSHSLYISRYPYGREATISWPAPDFQIKNNTDYGVLIWPSYTGGSITVRLYSTEHAPGEQVAQYKSRGRCTNVETIRERTFPDGSTERDSVVATYRPAQGVRC